MNSDMISLGQHWDFSICLFVCLFKPGQADPILYGVGFRIEDIDDVNNKLINETEYEI